MSTSAQTDTTEKPTTSAESGENPDVDDTGADAPAQDNSAQDNSAQDNSARRDDESPETASSTSSDAGTDAPQNVTGGRRRTVVRAIGATVLAALIAGCVAAGVLGWQLHRRVEVSDAAREASDTARAYAVTLTSIDSASIDQNFQSVLDGATGEFKDVYGRSSEQLKTLLVQNQAVSKGEVVNSGVASASPDRVTVLLFVDQTVRNTQSPEPRVDRSRITMTMEKVDGRWLAAKVDLV